MTVGKITERGSLILFGNFLAGFTGNMITESFNNWDIEDPEGKKSSKGILFTSVASGTIQMFIGKGPISMLKESTGLPKKNGSNYIASFFGEDLDFLSGIISYIFADGIWGTIEGSKKVENKE